MSKGRSHCATRMEETTVRICSVYDLASTTSKQPVVLDLRAAQAFNEVHVPGAVHMQPAEVEFRLSDIPRSSTVFVLGDEPALADMVTLLLERNDFEAVLVRGGTAAWRAAGLPTTQVGNRTVVAA